MWSETTCPNCGSTGILTGNLCSANPLSFRSEHTRFLRLGAADTKVTSHLCLDCGCVFLDACTDEIKSLARAISIFALKTTATDKPEHIGVVWSIGDKH